MYLRKTFLPQLLHTKPEFLFGFLERIFLCDGSGLAGMKKSNCKNCKLASSSLFHQLLGSALASVLASPAGRYSKSIWAIPPISHGWGGFLSLALIIEMCNVVVVVEKLIQIF